MTMVNILYLTVSVASITAVFGGTTYQRWGSSSCSGDSELVYSGFMAGSDINQDGNGVNSQCLPYDPEYESSTYDFDRGRAQLAHGEYRTRGSEQGYDIPCAVCNTYRSNMFIMPAKKSCPQGWAKEYDGFLMAPHNGWDTPNRYECVDSGLERIDGTSSVTQGSALFAFTAASCDGWGIGKQCPPYVSNKRIYCAVCTR